MIQERLLQGITILYMGFGVYMMATAVVRLIV